MVQIGTSYEHVTFFVTDKLSVSVMLGFDYYDHHVEAIKPQLAIVEMDYESTVPIIKQLLNPHSNVPLPYEKWFLE